jgi:hypothetical protein
MNEEIWVPYMPIVHTRPRLSRTFLNICIVLILIVYLFAYSDSVDALREEVEVVSSDSEPIYDQSSVPWSRYVTELARGEIIVLMFIRFIGLFGQTCLETIVTPMMRTYFDYDDFANRFEGHNNPGCFNHELFNTEIVEWLFVLITFLNQIKNLSLL